MIPNAMRTTTSEVASTVPAARSTSAPHGRRPIRRRPGDGTRRPVGYVLRLALLEYATEEEPSTWVSAVPSESSPVLPLPLRP